MPRELVGRCNLAPPRSSLAAKMARRHRDLAHIRCPPLGDICAGEGTAREPCEEAGGGRHERRVDCQLHQRALAELNKRASADSPGEETENAQAARRELSALMSQRRKRLPDERRIIRESAFYVDLDVTGARWARPGELPKDKTLVEIINARNDYAILRVLIDGGLQPTYQELRRRLATWPERPELPNPASPTQ